MWNMFSRFALGTGRIFITGKLTKEISEPCPVHVFIRRVKTERVDQRQARKRTWCPPPIQPPLEEGGHNFFRDQTPDRINVCFSKDADCEPIESAKPLLKCLCTDWSQTAAGWATLRERG